MVRNVINKLLLLAVQCHCVGYPKILGHLFISEFLQVLQRRGLQGHDEHLPVHSRTLDSNCLTAASIHELRCRLVVSLNTRRRNSFRLRLLSSNLLENYKVLKTLRNKKWSQLIES